MIKPLVTSLVVFVLLPHAVEAQRGRALVEEGNRLYRDSRFEEAHQKYLDALREAPGTDLIRFNDGNALYKSEDYQRAMDAYRGALESGDPALQARAWYNLGNALFRAQELERAGDAFKRALRLDPTDADAKHNLERVMEQQQQQQQQEQQQPPQEPEDDQSDPRDDQQPQREPEQEPRQDQQGQQQPEDGQNQPEDPQEHPSPQGAPSLPQMTREEAERLLHAIQEDPSKIQPQRSTTATRRRPRKKW